MSGTTYTIGYTYKCGCCKKNSNQFKEERGMKRWKRLHFKFNPECKKYEKESGTGIGFNNHFVDEKGKRHNTSSARCVGAFNYKIPKKAQMGHSKKAKKQDLEDYQQMMKFILEAADGNAGYVKQMMKDVAQLKTTSFGFDVGEEESMESN
jgi:hypothetical protein